MTGPVLTRNEAKARRLAIKQELKAQGYSKAFVEQLYQRMVRHDQLRRERAVAQTLDERAECSALGCGQRPVREVSGRVLLCAAHADEYEAHADHDWR